MTTKILDKYKDSANFDNLWNILHQELKPFGVSSIFYAVDFSKILVEEQGIMDTIWSKTTHPEDFCKKYNYKDYIEFDLSAIHCFVNTTPFVWHDRNMWGNPTKEQKAFMLDAFNYKMGVGVSLPTRFNNYGMGGMGLATKDLSEDEFDKMWAEHQQEFQTICYTFDKFARDNYAVQMFNLTKRELQVLTYLAIGKTTEVIAGILNTSPSTVEKQIRSAKNKLMTKNNEQAVVKALLLGIIVT